jgi:outer membrane protein assembly factor BamB
MRGAVIFGCVIGVITCWQQAANAQARQMRGAIPLESRVTVEPDRVVQRAMTDAQQLIKQKQFAAAITLLQTVLDHSEDYFLVKDFKAASSPNSSAKSRVARILAELPTEGRAAYELQFGTVARDLLNEGLLTDDLDKLAQVAGHFQMTAAGFEAMQALAASALDHNQPLEAALLCEAMQGHPRAMNELIGPLMLQTAFAWHLAGQTERSLATLQGLTAANVASPWRIGGRDVKAFQDDQDASAWLVSQFGRPVGPEVPTMSVWRMPRGGVTGNESATPTCPVGGGAWTISPLKYTRFLMDDEKNQQRQQAFDELARQIERMLSDDNRLTQPAAMPIIVGDVVVYRTLNDVTAVRLQTGELLWRSSVTDGMLSWLFQSPAAMSESMAASLLTIRGYLRLKLFRDQLAGSLTSDGKNVYAVEETDSQFAPLMPRVRQPFGGPSFAAPTNKLVAYDLEGGRLLWEIGGPQGTPPADLSGYFFLGPPLPADGRLYCLAEDKDELRLLALVARPRSVELEWSQSLVAINDGGRVALPRRRLAGVMPVIAEGVMICPTVSGSVIAFDLTRRQLRWGYSYESLSNRAIPDGVDFALPPQIDEEEGRWLDGGPILAGGRVVLTPRDSGELHCLNLVDGTLAWKRRREQGLYLACVNHDAVIVVGGTQVTAYSLADGTEVWAEPPEIDKPSGRGIRVGSQYLLPLSTGEIATLDLSTGRILGRSKLPEGRVPGNLAVGAGTLVSRGTHDVIGFRALADIEQQIAGELRKNPDDAEALALRGELRLHRGDEGAAMNDLRQSLKERPNPQVKQVLAATLLASVRNDLPGVLKAAEELETLTDNPRQRIEFLRLYGRALTETGDRVGAVTQLFRLAELPELPDEMLTAGAGHFVALDQNIRSQLATIYQDAGSGERIGIARVFAREFDAVLKSGDHDQRLSRFVKFVVGHPAADAFLLRLTNADDGLADPAARTALLERLAQSGNKSIAANAVATLASRSLADNSPRNALPWIEDLARDFAQVVCLEGKTGRQLSGEWLARDDVRDSQTVAARWPEGTIDAERTKQNTVQPVVAVDIMTHVGSHFVGWTFEMDSAGTLLTARDPSLQIVWRLPLVSSVDLLRMQPRQLHIRGQRLAFSSGTSLVVMESTDAQTAPRILFEQSLRPAASERRTGEAQPDSRLLPNGRQFKLLSDGRGTAGFLIGLGDEGVYFQFDNRLMAVEPDTGRLLWSRVGAKYATANATVDKLLTLHTTSKEAILLRPIDGSVLQRHKGNPRETPRWFQGTRRLSQRTEGTTDQRTLEMRDFDGDNVVWQVQYPAGSVTSIVDNEEIAVLEPSGKLTVLEMNTGVVRTTSELPVTRPVGGSGVLFVQRCDDRYVVVAGIPAVSPETRQIFQVEIGSASVTVDGYACAIGRNDGQILWSVPLKELAFDPTQSAKLPVLILAARFIDYDRQGQFAPSHRLSAMILDKQTGRNIYETLESLSPVSRAVQCIPMIDERKLIVDFTAWQLELTFPPDTRPKPEKRP